jgi:hypothetical protein
MDLNRIQGGIDKAQEHLDKLRKPGAEQQSQAVNENQPQPAEQQAAGQEPTQSQAWQGDERREEQTEYEGDDRRKQEYSYGNGEKPVGDEASDKPGISDPEQQST